MDRVSAGTCVNTGICVDLLEFGNLPSGMQVYIYIYAIGLDLVFACKLEI